MILRRIAWALTGATIIVWSIAWGMADVDVEAAQTPHQIIERAANAMAEQLDGRKEYFQEHPEELFTLINDVLLPHFDTRYAGRLVLGKHWKTASQEQRTEFIDVFYDFMLQGYANGVLEFDQNMVKVLPLRGELDDKRAVVYTEMRLDDGTEVPVNYSMRKSSAGWRVYDVRIEGISYIQNYRNQFSAEIRANGVDAVIERLRTESAVQKAAEAQ